MSPRGFSDIVNKKALFDYHIVESMEAGIELTGPEVKSIRLGQASLREAFIKIIGTEAYLVNMQITPYKFARREDIDERRSRRLLLHRRELLQLTQKLMAQGLTAVPVKIYLKGRRFKVQVGVARGRQEHEKRERVKRRDIDMETKRAVKDWQR
jgi:SsrA-binding protein